MERRHFVKQMAYTASVAILSTALPVSARACAGPGPAIWQITRRRTDLPQIFFDGFRLTATGSLQAATWSAARVLLAVAEPVALSAPEAQAFRDLVDGKMPGLFGGGYSPTGPGPVFEIGRAGEGGSAGSRSAMVTPEDAELIAALDGLSARLHLAPPAPGHYVWTKPVSAARPVDLDVRDADCQLPIAAAIAQAAMTGDMIVPVEEGYQDYLSGPLAGRVEFGARLPDGYLGYGVLDTV